MNLFSDITSYLDMDWLSSELASYLVFIQLIKCIICTNMYKSLSSDEMLNFCWGQPYCLHVA